MKIYIGEFPSELPSADECLSITFSTGPAAVPSSRKNKNAAADFVTQYVANVIPENHRVGRAEKTRDVALSEIEFISNELLENGFKYNFDSSFPIRVGVTLDGDRAVFTLLNSVDPAGVKNLEKYLRTLLSDDPLKMYLEQLERNAVIGGESGSRVGFLSMQNDYGAALAWVLETDVRRGGHRAATLTTWVRMRLTRESPSHAATGAGSLSCPQKGT